MAGLLQVDLPPTETLAVVNSDGTALPCLVVTPSGGGGVVTVTGSAPITSSGGVNPDIAILPATTLAAGSMSAADKAKLNSLPTLPVLTVTGTAPIASSGGQNPALSITPATNLAAGSMSAPDKAKLDLLSSTPVNSVGGTAPIVSSGGQAPVISITPATGLAAGSMSAADKAKLDALPSGGVTALKTTVNVPGGGAVPGNSGTTLSVTVAGVLATDAVFANQTSALFPGGMSICNAFASGANTITLEILNCTTTAKTIPSNFPLIVGILR